jgi:cystathionine gamma-lyase
MNFETKVIHDGQEPEPETGAIMYPIFYTSTYVQKVPGQGRYEYSRSANPTRDRLQEALAGIEKGNYALAFASGLAAATTLMFTVQPGSRVLCCNDLYGGSYRLFRKVFEKYQIEFLFLDLTDLQNLEDALADPQSAQRTTMLWLESPSNPLLKLVDIQRASEIAHRYGITVVVDNTFATPYLQNPLDLGADLVLHSTTKYIGGHSDIIGGALIMKSESWKEQLAFLSKATGGVPSPMDAWFNLTRFKKRLRFGCKRTVRMLVKLHSFWNKNLG